VKRADCCSLASAFWYSPSACEAKCFHHQDTKGTKPTHPAFLNREERKCKGAKSAHPHIWPTDHTDRPRCFQSELGDPALSTTPSPKYERGERQNRRAFGTAAGENPVNDKCSLLEAAGFSPATGDSIACRSANTERNLVPSSAIAPLRLCVFAGWAGGWALRSLRFTNEWLGNSAFFWCSPLVSWCLGGSKILSSLA
jgi:hypothetical protein